MWPHKTALIHGLEQIARLLYRENSSEPWGFRLSGGKDQGQPLQISQVGKSWKGRKLRIKITLYTQSPIPSRLSRTVWPKRLVCSPTIFWSVSLVSRSTRWPMTRSLSMRQRSQANTFQKYIWWRGKKSDKSRFQAERSIQKAGDRFTMVIERWVNVSKDGKSWKGKGFPMNCPWHALPDYM